MLFTFFLFVFLLVLILLYVYKARLLEAVTRIAMDAHVDDPDPRRRTRQLARIRVLLDEEGRARRLGAQVLAVSLSVRHRVLRDGVHGGELARPTTPTASAPRCRASRRASPTC